MKAKKLLLAAVMACLAMTNLQAKNIYYVKVNGTGNGNSWSNASGNIQDMTDKATVGDEVWVAAGSYSPSYPADPNDDRNSMFVMKEGVHLYGGFAGNETSVDNRAKKDKDGNETVDAWEFTNETTLNASISMGSGYLARFKIETQFDGFTVAASKGINAIGKIIINNCLCDGSRISIDEGTVSNCKITNNSSYSTTGRIVTTYLRRAGGIDNIAGTVSNCVISNNSMQLEDKNDMTCSVYGGGIYNEKGSVINCVVTGNSCTVNDGAQYQHSARGGGIYNDGGLVDHCIVDNNRCNATTSSSGTPAYGQSYYAEGGGIYNNYGTVSNCCVTNNFIYAKTSFSVPIYQRGGGIYNCGSSSDKAYIYCSTVVKNSAYNATGPNPNNIYTANNGNDFAYNCITEESDMTQFVNPDANDFRLKAGSKYIDAGSFDNLPDWVINGTDLAGNPRTHDGKISVGAYEYDKSYTNIPKLQQQGIFVFPSLAVDFVTVSGLQGNETLYFYNISGQLVITRKARGEVENIPIGHLPAGVYFVKAGNRVTKIIIK